MRIIVAVALIILIVLDVFFFVDALNHLSKSYNILAECRREAKKLNASNILDFFEDTYISAYELLIGIIELLLFFLLLYLIVEAGIKLLEYDLQLLCC